MNGQQSHEKFAFHAIPLLAPYLVVVLLRYALWKAVPLHPFLHLLVSNLIVRIRCIIDAAVDVALPRFVTAPVGAGKVA